MITSRRLLALAAVTVTATVAVGYAGTRSGGVSPANHETGNGRVLHPAGALTRVGNFPTGGALTPNGRFYWTVSTGRGFNDIRIVSTRRNRVVQKLPLPGSSGGIVMDPTRHRVYVSGIPDSRYTDQQRPDSPGGDGDVVHVFRYDGHTGQARFVHLLKVPPPSDAPTPQNFPPTAPRQMSWPDRLAVSPDGSRLLVPLNLADAAAIVDTKTRQSTYVN